MKTVKDQARLLARHQALIKANDPHPAKTLAEEWKENYSTVRTWLVRARRNLRSARGSAHR
jgi:hypothetical protein